MDVTFFTEEEKQTLKSCRLVDVKTDLTFYVQRDDSWSESTITYLRLDTFKLENFVFKGGYTDHTHVNFDGKRYAVLHLNKSNTCVKILFERSYS